jgi:hypothetical protein
LVALLKLGFGEFAICMGAFQREQLIEQPLSLTRIEFVGFIR